MQIKLHTHDPEKVLSFRVGSDGADEYYYYYGLEIEVAGPRISGSDRFTVSQRALLEWIACVRNGAKAELVDENGHGSITIAPTDSIGHIAVSVEIGSIWSDRAQIRFETDQTATTALAQDMEPVLRIARDAGYY